MILRWPVLAIWGDDPAIRRALSLIVLFIGGWTAITFVLVLTDVIDAKSNLWALMGIGAAIFVCWSVLWRWRTVSDVTEAEGWVAAEPAI